MYNIHTNIAILLFDCNVSPLFSLSPSWYVAASHSPWHAKCRSSSGFAGPRGMYGFTSGFV